MRRLDFSALVEVIDDLGGLDIPLSYAEIEHMNNYCVETSKLTGKDYTPLEKPEPKPEDQEAIVGTYHLTAYRRHPIAVSVILQVLIWDVQSVRDEYLECSLIRRR